MSSYNNRKSTGNITFTLVLILALAIVVTAVIFSMLVTDNTPMDSRDLRTAPERISDEEDKEISPSRDIEKLTAIQLHKDEVHFGELVLINNENAYVSEGTHSVCPFETPVAVSGKRTADYGISSNRIKLNPTVIDQLNLLFADYVKETENNDIYINEAYRTYEEQEAIYDAKGSDTATVPGYSEHHSGYAFDIAVSKPNFQAFNFEGHKKWIPENCKNYGFILRYPEGKQALTEIKFEPWHYRYVGLPHSVYITDNNLVLEEYIELLHNYTMNGTHLEMSALGRDYEVYYVPVSPEGKTTVYVPNDKEYSVSGNNKDGFIVTIDLSEKEEEAEAENESEIITEQ